MKSFPFYKQLDMMDCGPTCLRMIAKYYGKSYSLQALREKSFIGREGVSLLGISDAAEAIGFRTLAVKCTYEKLEEEIPVPCIAHWQQRHFIVIYKIKKDKVYVADPAYGLITYTKDEFLKGWLTLRSENEHTGSLLLFEPTPEFYDAEEETKTKRSSFAFLFKYLISYKKYLVQLFLGLVVGSILQLIFPFLTLSVVDFGIKNQDIGFVYLVLLAQLMLIFSRTTVDFIRSWILLHIGARINISIISDFLIKLMKLPVSFFDSKRIGDILQRIQDHYRIENFLTSSTLSILFSVINLFVFGIVLAVFNMKIFMVFLIASVMYAAWIVFFLKKRKELDYKRFDQMSENQSNMIQLITGMQEIKLNNCERQKRWQWEHIQARLFRVNVKGMALNQYQQAGAVFINELKNIIITFLAAKAVIDGHMSLGEMLAVQYIIGQLNAPIDSMIGFIQAAQDARISLDRLAEIHNQPDEEVAGEKITIFPEDKSLSVRNVNFHYDGPHLEPVLKNLSLEIPAGKITAIVGMSGSGKTTLVKLLLKFYEPTGGEIRLGDVKLGNLSNRLWREKCGAVLQDGFIFNDSIANNIAIGDERIDKEKLMRAVKVANIQEFIESLPLGYNTRIGSDGHGLSQGQKQRILIARAVYKDPEYLFFDEATNALDANNEKVIMRNLDEFFKGRTVVVVAHRLSTVKNADQIVVLDRGQIVEFGDHALLTERRGSYYNLVKNQLELGN